MIEQSNVAVTLPADVNQVDDTGYVWAFLSEARNLTVCDLGRWSSLVTLSSRSWLLSSN